MEGEDGGKEVECWTTGLVVYCNRPRLDSTRLDDTGSAALISSWRRGREFLDVTSQQTALLCSSPPAERAARSLGGGKSCRLGRLSSHYCIEKYR